MVGWNIESLLSGKFMKIWRRDGFIRALERGRAVRYKHMYEITGSRDVVPMVGQDVHGNRYYEDFYGDDANESKTAARWVEFSDRHEWWQTGRKIPAEWHGWLNRQYDDAPVPGNTSFHHPPFKRRHLPHTSGESHAPVPLGHSKHPYQKTFQAYIKGRVYHEWDPLAPNDKKKYD